MKKVLITVMIVLSLTAFNCAGSKNGIGIHDILKMNEREFQELEKISIEDANGFKYMKETFGEDKFKSRSAVDMEKKITKEDESKIKEILRKY